MAVVKYKGKNNIYYAYESTAKWDPVLKQSRPIRKYLGRVDPNTGDIIETKGKRSGRSASQNRGCSVGSAAELIDASPEGLISLQEEVVKLKTEVADLKDELGRASKKNQILQSVINNIEYQISRAKNSL